MALRRVHPASIAVASDGSVLINVVGLLPTKVQERLGADLGAQVFVGVALSQDQAGQVVARLDDAAAEASARLLAGRATKPRNSRKPSARKRR